MAAPEINTQAYVDALLVLGTAGVVVPLVQRLGLSPILGYLAAGALLGPLGLGSLRSVVPELRWVTVGDAGSVAGIAELGVVFLLFLIGLELSFGRLATMRRLVFGLGGLQVVLSAALLAVSIVVMGASTAAAIVLGLCLALSSTAIVLEVLASHHRMSTTSGRTAFAVLLAQDLAVVPLLLLIAVLSGTEASVLGALVKALLQAVVAVLAIVAAGRYLLGPLMRLVAGTSSRELFIAATLFLVVAAGVVSAMAGVSMALGAFVAGLMLAETEHRKAIETIIEPFKGLLLGVFFFTVGMKLDVREILAAPLTVVAVVAALVIVKAAVAYGLMRLFQITHAAASEASLMLGPGGEFAFVGIGMALGVGIIEGPVASFTLAVTALSMALVPLLYHCGRWLARWTGEDWPVEAPPKGQVGHAIIVRYGRAGELVGEMLGRHGLTFLAIETDADLAAQARKHGHPVYFGNAADLDFLERCGLAKARALVLTTSHPAAVETIVANVRALYPHLPTVARAQDTDHAQHLYRLGVTAAVPETVEASLQLSEALLVGLGLAPATVGASIREKREAYRRGLSEAASDAMRAGRS
ncbi:MAG: cation:proton antiporter [Hyphomicrobiaceae bacterium]|nr:cation:proton antiporter [Hyphomicrobiaceae bacterium]